MRLGKPLFLSKGYHYFVKTTEYILRWKFDVKNGNGTLSQVWT